MTYFTSDTHWGHFNIIKYCKRPFASVEEMDRVMAANWNAVVGPRDTVYHLGDFAMGKKESIPEYRKRLNGRIILIRGNHDRDTKRMLAYGFDEVHDELTLGEADRPLFLRHKPDHEGHKKALYHLCGHVHDKWLRKGNVINVGVDMWGFKPRTLEEILAAPKDKDSHIPLEDQYDR